MKTSWFWPVMAVLAACGSDKKAEAPTSAPLPSPVMTQPSVKQVSKGGFQQNKNTPTAPGVGDAPLSSVIALYTAGDDSHLHHWVVKKINECRTKNHCDWQAAPLKTDKVVTAGGLGGNVIVSWLDAINDTLRFGTNNDYLSYFGDPDGGQEQPFHAHPPQWRGAGNKGWLWVNHEYVSADNLSPMTVNRVPSGQYFTLARYLQTEGILTEGDITDPDYWSQPRLDLLVKAALKQMGGSWIRIEKRQGRWTLVVNEASRRYSASDDTLLSATGPYGSSISTGMKVNGKPLPKTIIPGTLANCSGGTSPWGTVFSGEENNHYFYGDPEPAFSKEGVIYDVPYSAPGHWINLQRKPTPKGRFYRASVARQARIDHYGWAVELDPGLTANDYYQQGKGIGHAKHTALGQARWENFSFVVDNQWRLPDDQPIVIYYANDRYGGRVYKFVSDGIYKQGFSKADARALLANGRVYVSHLPDISTEDGFRMHRPGKDNHGQPPTKAGGFQGQWIEMALTNHQDMAPNAGTSGTYEAIDPKTQKARKYDYKNKAKTTVGEALRDRQWNGLGAFKEQDHVLAALFTAATKLGIAEQNRPEDVEWNPVDKHLYVAYTKHIVANRLDQQGQLTNNQRARKDGVGRIWVFRESNADQPALSKTFQYWEVAAGSKDFCRTGQGFANPDNLLIDRQGGVWFGTDGQFLTSLGGCGDGLYYLDIHADTGKGTAYRLLTAPSNSEVTGPAFNSTMTTLFLSIQHPGETAIVSSQWPPR